MTTDPDLLIAWITAAQAQIKTIQSDIDAWKVQLSALYEAGTITDKLSTSFGTATLTQRTTWTYSPAIRQAQELEQLEGIATQKTSQSWTVKAAKPE